MVVRRKFSASRENPVSGEGPYAVCPDLDLERGGIHLRPVVPEDIEQIRQWRNAQMDVLRQAQIISQDDQIAYFAEQVWPEKQSATPRQILVAIEQGDAFIGYGGLVHIDWTARRGEVSFLLKPEIESKPEDCMKIFHVYLKLIQELAFRRIGLNRLVTETYAYRRWHIRTLEAAGFRHEGTLREHVIVDGEKMDSLMHGTLANEF